ncbi:MAG: hypothetical protein HYV09_11845 [Deltaproteobacteria bacterium]|nr:hypothetical protein [Deltaproteobacteria bacterium]
MKRALSIALSLALLAVVGAAIAEPTEAEKEAAKILFTEGKELRDAGKTAAALERFTRAYDLAPTPITTLELARTHAMLGHLVEARRLYRSVEGIEKKPGESAKSVSARDEAKKLALELDARIPTLLIKVTADEPIESASIDGRAIDVGSLPAPIAVDPGKHVVAVRAKTDASVTVIAVEGERDRVVTIEVPKTTTTTTSVVAPPPPATVVAPASSWPRTVRWVSGIAAGVGLVVGAGAGVLALSSASDVRDGCSGGVCPPSRHDDLDATRRWATVSTIGFGVAAVGATLFVVGVFSEPTKKDVAAARVVPYASLDGFGLTGRF